MSEQITIPISNLQLSITYVRPVINLWLDRALIVQKMFDVFEPWHLNVDDVEAITTGKPSEQGVRFNLPLQKITFFFGPAGCKFTKDGATWAEADETLKVLTTALDVLTHQGGVQFGNMHTSLALHLQPRSVPFHQLLRPFLAPAIAQLENSHPEATAYVIRWKARRITLDGSAALANGVYVHLERDFDSPINFEDMKAILLDDETTILKILDVEEVRS